MNAYGESHPGLIMNLKTAIDLLMLGILMFIPVGQARSDLPKRPFGQQPAKSEVDFSLIKAASGRTTRSVPFSAQVYESSDGVFVYSRIDTFVSVGRARKELKKLIRNGKVLERGPRAHQSGTPLRERVLMSLPLAKSSEPQLAVLWTDKTKLYRIESSSLNHVLMFEKRFYH